MKRETIYDGLFWTIIIAVYLAIGWFGIPPIYNKVVKPAIKWTVHSLAPSPIEQHIDSNKSKPHN